MKRFFIGLLVICAGVPALTQVTLPGGQVQEEGSAAPTVVTPEIVKTPPNCLPSVTLVITAESQWRQGEDVLITVNVLDPETQSVSLYLSGQRTMVGGRSRGRLIEVITKPTPPPVDEVAKRRTSVSYHVPFLDGVDFHLVAKAFGMTGEMVAKSQIPVRFIPSVVPKDMTEGVVVSKSLQRLYGVRDGSIVTSYLVSTGRWHPDGGGPTPAMKTRIINKMKLAHSKKYDVDMRYWNAISSDGSYGIHATYRNLYRRLGRADSHGCVRLHLADAQQFYSAFPVGTPVYVVR